MGSRLRWGTIAVLCLAVAGISLAKPPEGMGGARVRYDGTILDVFRLSTSLPELYKEYQAFTGPGYAFMSLAIDNKNGVDPFTWHCWTDRIRIILDDGTVCKSLDISEMDGFYGWEYADNFACTKTVYPGRKMEFVDLAFYPSFSWKNINTIYIEHGSLLGTESKEAY